MSLTLPWELGLPLAGASSCWVIQMWELQMWHIPGIWGLCHPRFPFALGLDVCGAKRGPPDLGLGCLGSVGCSSERG